MILKGYDWDLRDTKTGFARLVGTGMMLVKASGWAPRRLIPNILCCANQPISALHRRSVHCSVVHCKHSSWSTLSFTLCKPANHLFVRCMIVHSGHCALNSREFSSCANQPISVPQFLLVLANQPIVYIVCVCTYSSLCLHTVCANQPILLLYIVVLAFSLSRTLSTLYTLCSVWATLSLSIVHSALCVLHLCELSVCVLSTNPCSTLCTCYNVHTVEVRKSPQWKSLQWVLCAQHRFSGAAQYLRFTGSEGRGCTIFAYPITCTVACICNMHDVHNICISYHLHYGILCTDTCAQYLRFTERGAAQYLPLLSLAQHPAYMCTIRGFTIFAYLITSTMV